MDLDSSGILSPAELEPMAAMIPSPKAEKASLLPPGYRAVDSNRDDAVSPDEFAVILSTFDPSLTRWAATVFTAADTSKDGSLAAVELLAAATDAKTGDEAGDQAGPAQRQDQGGGPTSSSGQDPGAP